MTQLVSTGSRGGFDSVVLDSPTNRNALSLRLLSELADAVRASAQGGGRGLVVEHAGPSFCSGVDLKERRALARDDNSHSSLLAEVLRELWNHPGPVVAFVDGAVRGGGMGLLACADLVVVTETSTFAYSEARVGVAPALVMAVTLPTTSSRRLMPYLLSGDTFDAATAQGLGLVGRVVRTGGDLAVDEVLASFTDAAPGAQATIKRLGRAWVGRDVPALIEEMTSVSSALFADDEAREGMAAFAERRAPSWRAAVPAGSGAS